MIHLYLKRFVFATLFLLISTAGFALEYESFIVDGIGYKILSESANTVAVTNRAQKWVALAAAVRGNGPRKVPENYVYTDITYSGKVVIPATVTYDGITYTVTKIGDNSYGAFWDSPSMTSLTIPYTVTLMGSVRYKSLRELIIEDGDTELEWEDQYHSPFDKQPIETLFFGRNLHHSGYAANLYDIFGTSLKSVTIGDKVTKLPENMCYDCKNLTTVRFGKNVTSMGNGVFSGCSSLTSIDLTSKLTEIPSSTFWGCTSLRSVTFPQGVTSIQSSAFYGCTSLGSISLPNGLTSIVYQAFYGCTSLTTFKVPSNVTSIGFGTFGGCTNLKNFIIEDGETELSLGDSNNSPFSDNCAIDSIYLGRNINNSIKTGVWNNLTKVAIGDNVTFINQWLFRGYTKLTTVHFGKNVSSLGYGAFSDCTALTFIDLTSKMTDIYKYAFSGCTALQSVVWPQGLTTISEYAFSGCSSLSSIVLPNGLITIREFAFKNSGLPKISIPNTVATIERSCFSDCKNLKDVIIEDGDSELAISTNGNATFNNSPIDSLYIGRNLVGQTGSDLTLRALAFGDKVTNCGSWSGFTNLTSVYFGKNISTPSEYMFSGCTSLKHVDMTSKLWAIAYRTFYNCTALESVILPANMTQLGRKTFEGCSSLKSISIPGKVNYIGYYAFDGCTSLKDVVFEDGDADLVLESYDVSTFNQCPIDSVYLGRNLKKQDKYYYNPLFPASLTKLTIGSGVTSQWDYRTFNNCSNLAHISPLWEQPIVTSKNMFPDAVYANATLLVPGGTVKKYQATEAWKYFSNIVPTSIGVTMTATEGGSIRFGDEVVSGDTKLLQVKPNSLLTFEIAAEDEYYLESVVMNEVDVSSLVVDGKFTPTDLSEDIELTVTFKAKPYYTVTVTASEGGTAVVERESIMMGRNTTVTFTADEGHELVSVTVNGEDKTAELVDGVLTLNDIKENKVIVATFQKFRYAITATECENGSISLSASEVEWGDDVTITLVPDLHYEAATVSVNGEDMTTELTDNQLTIQDVREALTIDATFRLQTFTVSATCNEGGSVSLSSETAQWGTGVTITIEPDDEHFLESVIVNGTDVTSDVVEGYYTIASVECNTEILVTFVAKPYFSVTATVSSGGTAAVETNSVMWGCNTTVIFTAIEGYELASVTVNGANKTNEVVDGVLTLTDIIENTVVVATFQKLRFMITVAECEGGNISLSASEVEWGDNVTVTIAADEDYKLASLIVAGEDVTVAVEDNQYIIRSIKNNIEVSATFSSTVAFIHLSTDGESTYCSDHDLDFSQTNDIKAYIASGYYPETGNVLLTRVYEVPAGTGIVVKGSAGTHKVPFGKSSAYYLNLLAGNVDPITIEPTEEEYVNLYLTSGDDGLGFYRVTTPLEMEANSAHLQLPANLVSSGRRSIKIVYEDDSDIILMGDVNGDNEVDLSDAIMVTYYSLHVVPANFNEAAADMNGDGEIDLSDAIIIIYKSLGVK